MSPRDTAPPRGAAPIDRYRCAATYGRALGAHVAERGVALAPIAEAAGLDPAEFDRLDRTVSLDRFARLLEALATLTGDRAFGLSYAERFPLGGAGPLGYGMKSAATGRDALAFLVRFVRLNLDLAFCSLHTEEDEVRLSWAFPAPIVRANQLGDFYAALIVRHLRAIIGPSWRPKSARLTRENDGAAAPYRTALGRAVRFGAPCNRLACDAGDLRAPNAAADPVLFQLMRERCDSLLAERPGPSELTDRVREEALGMLGRGPVTAERVAARLGVSLRSLQRKLTERGASFQSLVDETRRELSDRLLVETDLPLQEIGRRLGFSAASSYTRSAARWYGCAPSEIRAAARRSTD